jgi:rhamnogalacturonan endolyase
MLVLAGVLVLAGYAHAARQMENLGRGVVAVRSSSTQVFVSWRLLGTDPPGIGFSLYRSTAGGTAVKLNSSVLTGGTNYTDASADLTKAITYFVKPVVGGIEQAASGSYTLKANASIEPCIVIPLNTPAAGYTTHFVWVGDLDGDGEYDYVVDRLAPGDPNNADIGLGNQQIEAYRRDGVRLWVVDLGINSRNTYNIEPGSSCIDVGHWDGVTVYDLDCDGRAEVAVRTANGVTFGDGAVLSESNNNKQFISVLNGLTGAERARIAIPQDYISDGPMGCQLGIGYLNGSTPSLVAAMKNRIGSGDFNMMICAWDFNGSSLTQKWKWLRGSLNCPDGHQMRIVDVDGDGRDEVCEIGFALRSSGTLLYSLGTSGVVHGDRWHIGKFDSSRSGLQGYGIQQSNSSGLREYYYDASTGAILWTNVGAVVDLARGDCGDIDPRYAGYEGWSFDGVWNGPSGTQITVAGVEPYPCLRLWWDGDDLSESYNDGKIEKWNYASSTTSRLVSTWNYETATRSWRGAPMFYGDILGDWREEAIHTSSDYSKLVIFTTDTSTSRRIYSLPHNPEYRNCMTIKGYIQSNQVDFYLGDGMPTPPAPDIVLVGAAAHPSPDPMTWVAAPAVAGPTSIAMTATTATSAGGVEYYFTCTAGGGHDSGWQMTATYTDSLLTAGGTYTYTVKVRNAVDTASVTQPSATASATLSGSIDTIYEAENAILSGAVVAANQSGYSGTGFADYKNNSADYVEWTVNASAAASCGISFRYALAYAGTDRPLEIRVNGAVVAASLSFPATGSWAVWTMTSPLVATLNSGANTIRATTIGSNGANVDYLRVSVAGPDTSAPNPDPATWYAVPAATSHDTITMTATSATDASPVEYYFANLTDPNHDSGWRDSPLFVDSDLRNNVAYTYQVSARDKSPAQNQTAWSIQANAATFRYSCQDAPTADLSLDCRIDFADLALFAGAYSSNDAGSPADFDQDGALDMGDLQILAGQWLQCARVPASECWQ